MAAKNETWLIVVIVLIAGVLIALSLTKNKVNEPAAPSFGVTVSVVNSIKKDHDASDMEKIAATKPVSAVVEMSPAVPLKQAFAVQVFSFKDKVRADAALKMIKEKGYPCYIMMSDLGARGIFYRVRVGSFASEEEARKNLESVVKDFKSGIIVAE
ncbi:MAG: SPOR domain-containing protein [Candidatus Omnitrophica bacterium]|nr:SPOR domain-containing protein [Candidatus Omnitrophota bacterium]